MVAGPDRFHVANAGDTAGVHPRFRPGTIHLYAILRTGPHTKLKRMKARLVLEDGSEFEGEHFGAPISSAGEVVFNTGMVGYPETMTDPSYAGQILVTTYPLIGNYGVPSLENTSRDEVHPLYESSRIHIRGLIVSSLSVQHSHWSAVGSLQDWMTQSGVPGLTGIDTRALTKRLRERGTMLGKLVVDQDITLEDPNTWNIVADVSINKPVLHEASGERKVVLVDLGAKNNILRSLLQREVSVLRVPWNYDWTNEDADGVFLSNGPGDPKFCTDAIGIIRKGLDLGIPIFGICLGHQLLALAGGGDTYKLKYGHRSQNQPCIEVGSSRCYITSQNHGFAVNERSLGSDWIPWLFNANDGTNEGIKHRTKPISSVQFHPEACPGPTDTNFLFDNFVRTLDHETTSA